MDPGTQLEIEGIGQQLATLEDWKKERKVFTHKSDAVDETPWSAWDEIESAHDFGHKYGFDSMGFGKTEKEAILNYCYQENIKPPFWW